MSSVKMGSKALRFLHLLHISLRAITFGALTTMLTLAAAQSVALLPDCGVIVTFIDFAIYQNGLRMILLTGAIYGLFTKWGFVKQRWVAAKWVVTIALMLLASVMEFSLVTGVVELAAFCTLYVLSVYKPFRKGKKAARVHAA